MILRLSLFSFLVTVSLFAAATAGRAEVTLSDSSFNSGWSAQHLEGTTAGTVAFTNPSTGGNPGAFGEMTVDFSPPRYFSSVAVGIFSSNLIYNPATDGPITSLTVSFDYKLISGTFEPVQFFALQNNTSFPLSSPSGPLPTTWTPFSQTIDVSGIFSKSALIEFGFGVVESTSIPVNTSVGFDNLVIKVATPEPATWALMILATVALGMTTRFRLTSPRLPRKITT